MANWVVLKRAKDNVVAKNCLLNENIILSGREALYLTKLNGNRNPYRIGGFSGQECIDYYVHLKKEMLIRKGKKLNVSDGIKVYTVFIPKKKTTTSIIPKIMNTLLCMLLFPLFLYGLYCVCQQGVRFEITENIFLSSILGYILGICGGVVFHEAGHTIACLSSRKGRWIEAGVMLSGKIPSVYVAIDDSDIKNRLKKVQVNMAGIEMNLFWAGIMMICLVNVGEHSFLFNWKPAILQVAIQNIFFALINITFCENLDGEYAISTIIGHAVDEVAQANIRQMFTRAKRKRYLQKNGLNGVAYLFCSVFFIFIQHVSMPLMILADISIMIGVFFI